MTHNTDPIAQLIHSTVRILCVDAAGKQSCGSGYVYFFCEHEGQCFPCIVTNKHVLRGAQRATFNLTLKKNDGTPDLGKHEAVVLEGVGRFSIAHPDPNVDLVAIPIGPILNSGEKEGKNYYFAPLGKNLIPSDELLAGLSPMEEIVMIGYPNGIWDEKHNLPIIRRGITATHARLRLNGKPEFLIDAACFPGSSGSPVLLANFGGFAGTNGLFNIGTRVALLGTLYAGPQHTTEGKIVVVEVPTDTKAITVGTIPNNLGFVIHASELLVLEDAVRRKLAPQPPREVVITKSTSRNSLCICGSGKRFKACCGTFGMTD